MFGFCDEYVIHDIETESKYKQYSRVKSTLEQNLPPIFFGKPSENNAKKLAKVAIEIEKTATEDREIIEKIVKKEAKRNLGKELFDEVLDEQAKSKSTKSNFKIYFEKILIEDIKVNPNKKEITLDLNIPDGYGVKIGGLGGGYLDFIPDGDSGLPKFEKMDIK